MKRFARRGIPAVLIPLLLLLTVSSCATQEDASTGGPSSDLPVSADPSVQPSAGSGPSGSPQASPSASAAVPSGITADEVRQFISALDEAARAGSERLLDHLHFSEPEDAEAVRRMLADPECAELWRLAYSGTEWFADGARDPDFSAAGGASAEPFLADVAVIYPDCRMLDLAVRAGVEYESLGSDYTSLTDYFLNYYGDLPVQYSLTTELLAVGGSLRIDGAAFMERYTAGIFDSPADMFARLIAADVSWTRSVSSTDAEQARYAYYLELVAQRRYVEAMDYLQSDLGVDAGAELPEALSVVEAYRALSESERALVGAELDKIPAARPFSFAVTEGERQTVYSFLFTYDAEYDEAYDVFGRGLPACFRTLIHMPSADGGEYRLLHRVMQSLFPGRAGGPV